MDELPIRIMIVEDEAAHIEAIERAYIARKVMAEIEHAGTLREYHARIAVSPPDIALLDLSLPDGTALEALTSQREVGPFPILVMTSHGNEPTAVEILKAGALDYIVKSPENFADMPHRVERALREWNLLLERKRAEESFKTLFNTIADAIFIQELDGHFLQVNQTACKRLGYSYEELLQMKPSDIDTPEYGAMVANRLNELQEKGQIVFESVHVQRNGSTIPVEISSQIIDFNGKPAILSLARDFSNRKKAEQVLRESESALKKAQKVAHVGSWVWHIPTNHLEWSDQMYIIFGIDKEDFSGDLADVMVRAILPEDRAAVEQANLSVINEKKPIPMEYRILWQDGTVRVVWAEAGELILDEANKPLMLSGIVQDITERKQAEMQIKEQLEELRRWHSATMGRENRILELKTEVNKLLAEGGKPGRYASAAEATHDI